MILGSIAVALQSIGCRTNQEEMNALQSQLSSAGCRIVKNIRDAQLVIINTCSVTACTESKTRRFLQSLSRKCPDAKVLVTGCFAQQLGEKLRKYPRVHWVVGNGEKHRILSILESESEGFFFSDIVNRKTLPVDENSGAAFYSYRTRFPLKIQEGCDFQCAYCIVPSLRGRSRSAPLGKLLRVFRRAVESGCKEIVITGTHIGQYRNPEKDENLDKLLNAFLEIPGDFRIRLSSLDPRDLTDNLLELVGEEDRVCSHLHVSVQSFSPNVLASMKRPYRQIDDLARRLERFRQKHPYAGLGADFIVGFPGETDEMFQTTLNRVKEIGFTYGHVFRFSRRPGTLAAAYPDQVPERVKSERSEMLRNELSKN
ncbi:MAG: tRNA (N(6)-L-threonylcarbamoyladenosine(37)-C(2))-methylthiotransferase MtaB, partial [Fibrobacterota bacterium]